jgi:hypothetical protein
MATLTIRDSYKKINSINLGAAFVKDNSLRPQQQYDIVIEGIQDKTFRGTVQMTGLIGGVAALYQRFPTLKEGETIEARFVDGTIVFIPPKKAQPKLQGRGKYVLRAKNAHQVFVQPYMPGALNEWEPKGEPDVYLAFGRLAEFTKYTYCCAASVEVLEKFGINIIPKPDAILIEEGTDRYIVAEFEKTASDFLTHKHNKEDIDLLICWLNDLTEAEKLEAPEVLSLKELLNELIAAGKVEL